MALIRAGYTEEIWANREQCDWMFVDIGFSTRQKSCAVLMDGGVPEVMEFRDLQATILQQLRKAELPLNLVVEAPLSVAFTDRGNPTPRSIEIQKGKMPRSWYVGAGAAVLLATTHLMRSAYETERSREVRLFEGFVSFKEKGAKSYHASDVQSLLDAVASARRELFVEPARLKLNPTDVVASAFVVAGMNFGVPPVIKGAPLPTIEAGRA